MHKVITMADSKYLNECGQLFLQTRNKINADFILYSPDLEEIQIKLLNENNIQHIIIDNDVFKNNMQFLKFKFLKEHVASDYDKKYSGFTFVDMDTFFINDWEHVFNYDFNIGITVRLDMIRKNTLRAFANGGVIFCKNTAEDMLGFGINIINKGYSMYLPEYEEIWNTLEQGRPEHKTHYRTNKRWWVDQVFLSSIVLHCIRQGASIKQGIKQGIEPVICDLDDSKIGLFSCNPYNVLNSEPIITNESNIYIRHLKDIGRKLLGATPVKEKL